MEDTSLTDRLERLGLSEKEIDTYLSILDHGEAKASTIADDAGVSKRYVYSVSEQLEDRGFVDVNDHAVPTLIRANPPEEVVERLSAELSSLGPDLAARWNRVTEERREFEIIKAQSTVVKRIREFLASAEDEVTLSVPAKLLPEIEDELRETVDRNVLVFLLLTGDESTAVDVADDVAPASVVRVWTERAPVLFSVDTQLGLFAPYELLARSNAGQQAVAIAQEQLVPILTGSFFGNYWPIAEEAHVADPEPLLTDYQSFRHAVFAATRYQNQDEPIVATVDARPVQRDGDYRELTGRVVDVRQGLVDPPNSRFAVENALVLDLDGDRVTVGGPGAFLEDYEARGVTLEHADD
ncbi:TrmB family transcriptional regulator [Halorubellus salinus]|uniref:TrmB family transcriptional regulator n=1 Tax=Halorubellus salinus TaxID=755309 RepID=UPI001D0989F4|nr:TrmB family transcriptional regulator sugar-binding domain-containing protein [Halorubellus salinus]